MPPLPLITLSETYTYSIGGDHVIPATRVGDVVVGSESENVLLHCFLSSFFLFSMTTSMEVMKPSSPQSRGSIVSSRS